METSSLSYKVAPLSSDVPGPHPTLIFLHGRGSDENDLLGLAPYLHPNLLIMSVQAPYRFEFGGYTWFTLDESGSSNIDELLLSRKLFLQCVDEILQKHPVDPRRLFLFGFSMGAMVALSISLSYPERFKGIVAHSGLLPQDQQLSYRWDELSDLSFFIAHGVYDPIVPVEFGREAQKQLLQAHATVLYREYPIQHTISEESMKDIAHWLQPLI